MKVIKVMMILGIAALVSVSAFAMNKPVVNKNYAPSLTTMEQMLDRDDASQVSLTGTLTLQNDDLALQVGSKTYLLGGVSNFGIVDGFKAGATMTVAGYLDGSTVYAQSVTIGGTTYQALNIADLDYAGKDYQNYS
jgi:hypothetical protein